jgi:hypothetical protein
LVILNGTKTMNTKVLLKKGSYMVRVLLSLKEKFMQEFGQMELK